MPTQTARFAARYASTCSHRVIQIKRNLGRIPFARPTDDFVGLDIVAGPNTSITENATLMVDSDDGRGIDASPGRKRPQRFAVIGLQGVYHFVATADHNNILRNSRTRAVGEFHARVLVLPDNFRLPPVDTEKRGPLAAEECMVTHDRSRGQCGVAEFKSGGRGPFVDIDDMQLTIATTHEGAIAGQRG